MSDEPRKYELGEQIASGGMGEVFRAKKIGANGFHRPVAIKRLHDSKALDFDARTMLQQEAQLCAMLDHPNIVPVWDFDEDSKKCVRLIMPYVNGVDLEDLLSVGMLPISVSVYVTMSILRGLAHAHSLGIVHRDIKPGNILISRAGAVQIADFGLARDPDGIHLAAQMDAGTFGYMSPEALQSSWQDARSDLFAVGAIFYELLTGIRAFPGVNYRQRIAQTLGDSPAPPIEVRPKVSQDLSDITMRLLAPRAADRFSSAQEVIDALPYPKHGMEDLAALVKERVEQGLISISAASTEQRPRTERAPEYVGSTRPMSESVLARALADVGQDPGDLAVPERISHDVEIALPAPRERKARRRSRWVMLALAVLAAAVVILHDDSPRSVQRDDSAQDSRARDVPVSQATPSEPSEQAEQGESERRRAESEQGESERRRAESEHEPAEKQRAQDMDAEPAEAADKAEDRATESRPAPGPARRRRAAPAAVRPVAAPPPQHQDEAETTPRPRPAPSPATEPAEYHIPIGRDGAADDDGPVDYDIEIRRKGEK